MTTLRIDSLSDRGAPQERHQVARISWSVARGAITPRLSITSPGRELLLSLEITLRADHSADSVVITVDGQRALEALTVDARGAWARDEHALLHVRIFETGSDTPLADLTIDTESSSPRVLYARTTILHALGIPGGRYELDGVELQTESSR